MALDHDRQRELDGELRKIEEAAGRLLRDIVRARGGDQRERRRVGLSKLEVFVAHAEDMIYDGGEDAEREHEIGAINRESDKLIQLRAELDRKRRRVRRAAGDVALDRRERDLELLEEELDAALDG
jgi:hypothetical protein